MNVFQHRSAKYLSIAIIMVMMVSGCGGSGGGGGGATGRATIAFSNDTVSGRDTQNLVDLLFRGSSSSPVPIEDIESLTVTVTEIVLQRCSGHHDGDDGDADDSARVHVTNSLFDPTSVTIEQGGKVRWRWEEAGLHTVTSGAAGDGDAGSLFDESGDTLDEEIEIIFPDVGLFPYFSNLEADIALGMAGTVEVVADGDGVPPGDDEPDDDSDEDAGGLVSVFSGAFDVDLLQLTTLSETLTSAIIPAGRYCKIRISIEDPRLVLFASSPTVMTNIQLTANGRLFIKKKFEIDSGGEHIIVIDFGGIHLIDAGLSGQFVLTPQLHADIDVESLETEIEGEIISIDCEAGIMVIRTDSGVEFEVLFDSETDFEDEFDSPIECTDLSVGMRVEAEGLLGEGNILEADEIEIEVEDEVELD